MRFLVTSDVHLGNQFCRSRLFMEMLKRLDESVILILGGDIIDAPGQTLSVEHQQALDEIHKRADQNQVIWIEGNHDRKYRPDADSKIEFKKSHAIGNRAFITHGDAFDNVMPRSEWFIRPFRFFHALRVKLGAHPEHVADYAKRFTYLYGFLRRKVMQSAVAQGMRDGFDCVVCGHVHYAEDTLSKGVRYINLGAWTESPCYCFLVDDENMQLVLIEEAMKNADWFHQQ